MARRRRHGNPVKLSDALEQHVVSFIERADRLSSYGYRLVSHLGAHPELSELVTKVAEVCDEAVDALDAMLDEE